METTTPTPITPAPLNGPSTGNGKKFLIVGALVLALGGGAFFLTQGGTTLKGSFVGGGANCPTIAEKDIARAKLLEPNADGKYILSVKYNDDTVLDPLSITWSSGDLPAGATIKSYTDNTAEVSGNTTCPFIFTAKVTTTDGSYANKIYYINPPAAARSRATTTTRAPAADAVITTTSLAATKIDSTALQAITSGATIGVTTDARRGGGTTMVPAVDQTKLEKGSKVIYQLHWSLDKIWLVGEIEKVVIDPATYETTYRIVGMNNNVFNKSQIALYSFHPETVQGAGTTLVGVGTQVIIKYSYTSYAGTAETEYVLANVDSVNGNKVTVSFKKHIDKSGGMTTGKETFDRTEVWMSAKDANL